MRAESTALRLDRLHGQLYALDWYLAKALGVSEINQIARLEGRLRSYLLASWNSRKQEASISAGRLAREGKSAAVIIRTVRSVMQKWFGDVTPTTRLVIRETYRLAREAGWKKATGRISGSLTYSTENYSEVLRKADPKSPMVRIRAPKFDLVDRRVVEILERQQVLWIGEHYDKNIAASIARTAKQSIVETGLGTHRAGIAMGKAIREQLSYVRTPTGWAGSQSQYHELLAANTVTLSRAQGQLRSFAQLGVTRYRISNPMDRRTCERCEEMNGRIFTTQQGLSQMQKDLEAESPDAVRKIHPWHSVAKVRELTSGEPGPRQSEILTESGMSLPPYHGRCRCTIDIDADPGAFSPSIISLPSPLPKSKMPIVAPKPPVDPKGIPGMFPELPKHSASPTSLFDLSRLQNHLRKVKEVEPGVNALSKADQAAVRRELNSLCAERGMKTWDVAGRRRYASRISLRKEFVGPNRGVAGTHHGGTGEIEVTEKTRTEALAFRPSRPSVGLRGFKTLVHESVHGTSPIRRHTEVGVGLIVEEGTAEVATLRIIKDKFFYSRLTVESVRSYESFIKILDESVASGVKTLPGEVRIGVSKLKATTISEATPGSREILERSAIKMRGPTNVRFGSPRAYAKHWIENVDIPPETTAGLEEASVDKLTKDFRKAISKKFFELAE